MFLSNKWWPFIFVFTSTVHAEVNENQWPLIQESYFSNRQVFVSDFLKISAPKGAENSSQVPVSIYLKNQKAHPVKRLYLIVDANPIPLVAEYVFPHLFAELKLSTRIRMEGDSNVRLIAEDEDGKLWMAATRVNAGGGCAGNISDDESEARVNAGKIKFQKNSPYKFNQVASATLQIKHPMYTGLQYDSKTKDKRKAFFIKKAQILLNESSIFLVNFGLGTAENPYIKFEYDLPENFLVHSHESLVIQHEDNEGRVLEEIIE